MLVCINGSFWYANTPLYTLVFDSFKQLWYGKEKKDRFFFRVKSFLKN